MSKTVLSAQLGTLLFTTACLYSSSLPADDLTLRHVFTSLQGNFVAERVLDGISQPTAITFLPDGRALVAQRDRGLLTLADFATGAKTDVSGLPPLVVFSDAGVHDIELHPEYDENGWIYVAYTEGKPEYSTAVIDRFRLEGEAAVDVERVFTADAYSEGAYHYAARMQFLDGYLYFALGDREHPSKAQDNSNHAGTVVRLRDDGGVPQDNPFVGVEEEGKPEPRPEIWSYGHRDPMGLYVHPETGELWLHEHGPRGGDELNRIEAGTNFGWPAITYGVDYSGAVISPFTEREGMAQPAKYWVPSIAPSGLCVYEADLFSEWRGDLLLGALVDREVRRMDLVGGDVVAEEALFEDLEARVRDVRVGPEGALYVLLPDRIVRVTPAGSD
jgi:glucose/arabinose dehydrogenase